MEAERMESASTALPATVGRAGRLPLSIEPALDPAFVADIGASDSGVLKVFRVSEQSTGGCG